MIFGSSRGAAGALTFRWRGGERRGAFPEAILEDTFGEDPPRRAQSHRFGVDSGFGRPRPFFVLESFCCSK